MNLNKLKDQAYKIACDHGFHDKELSNEHWLCLVVSELMETVEADRKGKRANVESYKLLSQASIERTGNPEYFNEVSFCHHIKDSVEDEISDAFIRLLDLYGLRGIDLNEDAFDEETIQEYTVSYQRKSFTECMYYIMSELTSRHHSISESAVLPEMLLLGLLGLAKHLDIDLMWHIEQKMKYNQSRERMHGKKY